MDGGGIGGGGVVGGDVDHVAGSAGGLGHRGQVVGVREGVVGAGEALTLQVLPDDVHLVDGVGLCRAVEQAHVLGVGEEVQEHLGLVFQGGQVGGAGDVGAGGAGPVLHLQGGGIVGDGGAQDGDVRGAGLGGLEGGGAVGHDQVHPGGDEPVDDGSGVGGLAGGVVQLKLHAAAGGGDQLGELVLEPLGGLVQGGVLHLLADAHGIAAGGGGAVAGGVGGGVIGRIAPAGGQGQGHGAGEEDGKEFLLVHGELTFFPRNAEWWNIPQKFALL